MSIKTIKSLVVSSSSANNQQQREKKLGPEHKEKMNKNNATNNNSCNNSKSRIRLQLTSMTQKENLGKTVKWGCFALSGFIFIRFKQKTYRDCHIFLKQNFKMFQILK